MIKVFVICYLLWDFYLVFDRPDTDPFNRNGPGSLKWNGSVIGTMIIKTLSNLSFSAASWGSRASPLSRASPARQASVWTIGVIIQRSGSGHGRDQIHLGPWIRIQRYKERGKQSLTNIFFSQDIIFFNSESKKVANL